MDKNIGTFFAVLAIAGMMIAVGAGLLKAREAGVLVKKWNPPKYNERVYTSSVTTLSTGIAGQFDETEGGILYYYEPLEGWQYYNPDNIPSIELDKYYGMVMYWSNTGSKAFTGHVDVTLTKPDGSTLNVPIDKGQDFTADPDSGIGVQFHFLVDQKGSYDIEVTLSNKGTGSMLDTWSDTVVKTRKTVNIYSLNKQIKPTSNAGYINNDPRGSKFSEGTDVHVWAGGYGERVFDHWEGDLSGAKSSRDITMNENKLIIAVFDKSPRVNVLKGTTPDQGGEISITPQGPYEKGQTVEIRAIPNTESDYVFDHWYEDVSGNSNPREVEITHDDFVIGANFTSNPSNEVTLSTEIAQGKGSIDPSSGSFLKDSEITLNARPAEDYNFDHWGGEISGSENPKTITISQNLHVKAYFTTGKLSLTTKTITTEGGYGGGSITKYPQEPYEKGDVVEIQANPNQGYTIDHWEGDVPEEFTGQTTISVSMNRDRTVVAVFREGGIWTRIYRTIVENKVMFSLLFGTMLSMVGLVGYVSTKETIGGVNN